MKNALEHCDVHNPSPSSLRDATRPKERQEGQQNAKDSN